MKEISNTVAQFCCLLICAAPLWAQELIVNGSFENTSRTFQPDANGVMSILPGSNVIPGWTTTNAELGWVSNQNPFGPTTTNGSLFLDLTGYSDAAPYGGVTQAITTTPGQIYRVSFSLGADQDQLLYRGPVAVAVLAGSSSNSFTFTPPGSGNQWMDFTMDFTAAGSSTRVTITGAASAGGEYLGLDNVALNPSGATNELIVNGSFEQGTNTGGSAGMSLLPNSMTLPGWRTTAAELAWLLSDLPYGLSARDGELFLDLTGFHDALPYGGVTQLVPTSANQSYRLSFSLGSYQDSPALSGPMSVSVTAGSVSNYFTFTPPSAATGNLWMTFSFDFVPNAASTPLTIIGTGAAGGSYIGLDNVSARVPTGAPRITGIEALGKDLHLSFTSQAGKNYLIGARAELGSGTWTNASAATYPGNGGIVQVTLTNAVTNPHQFYRVEQLP